VSGIDLDPEEQAIPCGLIAKSIFTDDFSLIKEVVGGPDSAVEVTRTNIAWASDIEYSFKNIEGRGDWKDIQWIDMTDGKLFFLIILLQRTLLSG
jgi:hypothetical protein